MGRNTKASEISRKDAKSRKGPRNLVTIVPS